MTHPTSHLPFRDTSLPIAERVADLLGHMTLEEKVGQMLQLSAHEGVRDMIENKHIGSMLHASPQDIALAHELTEASRLGIPLLIAEDCIHGHSFFEGATIFPTQLGMAATWDAQLVEQAARATAVEASSTGVHWTFSPVLCITRDLRWGRVSETFGEDPHLIGELGSAMVRGYQGDGLTDLTSILACAKHFAGYSETQGGRDASESDISPRKLRSWFLPPFERVAREGSRTFMLGYQSTEGQPITISDWLLNGVLRDEWDYRGLLVTDWDNVGRMVWEQKVFATYEESSAAAVNAGNDMIMTTSKFFQGALDAVANGRLEETKIDAAVRRILRVKFELGLFENPRKPDLARQQEVIQHPDHVALNLDLARRSLTLLSNDGVLPLAAGNGGRIAVIGPNADDHHTQLGDWAGNSGQAYWIPQGHPRELTATVLDGVREIAPEGWEVTYAKGANIVNWGPDPDGEFFPDGQPRPAVVESAPSDPELLADAVAQAQAADVAVVVVGDRIELIGETKSTATLELLGGQIELLEAVAATGTPMIVVLIASKPPVLPPAALNAAALIYAYNPGMRGGIAVAELLFGLIEPSGRLPLSVARHVGQQPIYYNQIRGQHGTRYADFTQEPQFPFGFGLSYTTVEYSDLEVHTPQLTEADTVRASIKLHNTGSRPSTETVQVYVRDVVTSVTWADRELKTFTQVQLAPGEERTVELSLPVSQCTIVDPKGLRLVEPGEFELLVGPSSREADLLSAGFEVTA